MYLVKLTGILADATKVQEFAELPSKPHICTAEPEDDSGAEDEAGNDVGDPTSEPTRFAIISKTAREKLLRNLPRDVEQPLLIQISTYAKKELSVTSMLPHLDASSTSGETSTCPQQDTFPVRYFFYGSLADPEKLAFVLGLSQMPTLRDAVLQSGKIRIWGGKYKALVDGTEAGGDEQAIDGKIYEVQSEEDEMKLRVYETDAYEVVRCVVELGGNAEPHNGTREGGEMTRVLTFRFCKSDQELD